MKLYSVLSPRVGYGHLNSLQISVKSSMLVDCILLTQWVSTIPTTLRRFILDFSECPLLKAISGAFLHAFYHYVSCRCLALEELLIMVASSQPDFRVIQFAHLTKLQLAFMAQDAAPRNSCHMYAALLDWTKCRYYRPWKLLIACCRTSQ